MGFLKGIGTRKGISGPVPTSIPPIISITNLCILQMMQYRKNKILMENSSMAIKYYNNYFFNY
jgi:hypothetical protein